MKGFPFESDNQIRLPFLVKSFPKEKTRSSSSIFSSGTRNTGDILLYDVRQKECVIKFQHHRQEVCGLKWCPNGRYLASGSNDNTVCVWDFHQWYSNGGGNVTNNTLTDDLPSFLPPSDKSHCRTKPLWQFKEHTAAVKVESKQICLLTRRSISIYRRLLGVHGKIQKYSQRVVVTPMVTYVFGIIAMGNVNKRSKQILKYLAQDMRTFRAEGDISLSRSLRSYGQRITNNL